MTAQSFDDARIRYLTLVPSVVYVETALRAEELFERSLGRQLAATEFFDTVKYTIDSGARLPHTPVVSVISVAARAHVGRHLREYEPLGSTDWISIDPAHTVLHQKDGKAALIVPQSMFGSPYDEVRIRYVAGLVELPQEILDAVTMIYDGLRSGEIDDWNQVLPDAVYEVINRYRKEVS